MSLYGSIADLFHHLRNDITGSQLSLIIRVYCCYFHNSSMAVNLHTLFAKMIYSLVEPLMAKESGAEVSKLLTSIFDTSLERLDTLLIVHEEVTTNMQVSKDDSDPPMDLHLLENRRPFGGASFASEKVDDVINGMPPVIARLYDISLPV
jgi:transformation/transcription domain-associated protein